MPAAGALHGACREPRLRFCLLQPIPQRTDHLLRPPGCLGQGTEERQPRTPKIAPEHAAGRFSPELSPRKGRIVSEVPTSQFGPNVALLLQDVDEGPGGRIREFFQLAVDLPDGRRSPLPQQVQNVQLLIEQNMLSYDRLPSDEFLGRLVARTPTEIIRHLSGRPLPAPCASRFMLPPVGGSHGLLSAAGEGSNRRPLPPAQ